MKQLIENFTSHLSEAIQNVGQNVIRKPAVTIQNVLITGLGGSGIGGTIVAELNAPYASLPITINKNYLIPEFVGPHTLVIACSYSGDTEETLMATKAALSKGAEVACICSGGELMAIAKARNLNYLDMPGGNPPRSMFGYSFVYLNYLLEAYGVIQQDVVNKIQEAISLLNSEKSEILEAAEELALILQNKIPVVYAVSGGLGIAARWRQQLNENAKMLSWEAEIPEMNHNELVGWEGGDNKFTPIFLRNHDDFDRNQHRIGIIKEIIGAKTPNLPEVWSKGDSAYAKALYLINFGDWVSYYLSEINQVDIMDIKSIDRLKAELSKIPL